MQAIKVNKMTYSKRLDNRGFEETRPIEAKIGIIPNADGSAYFKMQL